MRLIDAEVMKRYIDCGHLRSPTELCFSELDVVRMLDKQPTVDATPVKHGRWDCVGDGWFFCEACKKHIVIVSATDEMNYCPYCGARMDGGNDGAAD